MSYIIYPPDVSRTTRMTWQVALRWSLEATCMSLLYEEGSALFFFFQWASDLVMRSEDNRNGDLTLHDNPGYDDIDDSSDFCDMFLLCFWHHGWSSLRFSWPGHRTMAISPRYGDYKNCERVGSTKARVNVLQMKVSTYCNIGKVNDLAQPLAHTISISCVLVKGVASEKSVVSPLEALRYG